MVKPTPDPPNIPHFSLPADHPLLAFPRLVFDLDNKVLAKRYAVYFAKREAERRKSRPRRWWQFWRHAVGADLSAKHAPRSN
ncbi:hypothetical protein [Pseudomonas abieticivorans]|uniref:hypothetical protein n=1 Tax=Pseudomonas abieticivorans TaxID=2931382 RepID=UPI0020BFE1FA|nr:hypothetical protein [Pseudomonas sp. PIA16]